jgi:uncharacterized protein (TIGR02598 family)
MKTSLSHLLSHLRTTSSRQGFSLVEVVLAVGIMALGVVTILGLLPHGLEMSRRTANEQAETRIVDQLMGELQAADWSTMAGLLSAGQAIHQFDDQGLRLEASDQAQTTYVARVLLENPSEKDDGMIFPSKAGLEQRNKFIRRVRIEVAATQSPQFNFDNPPPAAVMKRFTSLIAKMRP